MIKSIRPIAGAISGLCFSVVACAQPGKVIDSPNCVTSEEYAEIVRRHTELGELERDLGCKEITAFNKQMYQEKRKLHRRTVTDGLSQVDYAKELAELEAREDLYTEQSEGLRQKCAIPATERLALKREADQRGRCSIEQ
ncbi:MAG: hypothetical protein AB8B48_09035 [Pseudomonadales bacterium]